MNIAEILKDAPKGTKLYSPLLGECELIEILDDLDYCIRVKVGNGHEQSFTKDGKFFTNEYFNNEAFIDTECLLFPSKENRNWNKFLIISPGDVIVSPHGVLYLMRDNKTIIFTYDLNIKSGGYVIKDLPVDNYRKATSRETTIMFNAIKEAGFKYNPATKSIEIVKLAQNHQFEPFDKVLVRHNESDEWRCNYFSHMDGESYVCVGTRWNYCIPYNNETKHLVGTNKDFNY